MSKNWNQPICERCWISQTILVMPDSSFQIRQPVRLSEPNTEQCAYCGAVTIFGAYVRANPDSVPFPTQSNKDD